MEFRRSKATFGIRFGKSKRMYVLQFTTKEPWFLPKYDREYGENKNIVLFGWLFVYFGYIKLQLRRVGG